MASPITWKFNTVDLYGTYARGQGISGEPFASPGWRGDDVRAPKQPGAQYSAKTRDTGVIALPFILRGANSDGTVATDRLKGVLESWRALRRTVYTPDAVGTLSRAIAYAGGTSTVEAAAQINPRSLELDLDSPYLGRCVLEFELLDGCFHDASATTITCTAGAGTGAVGGDIDTRRMTVTFSGSASAQALTNTTNGCVLTCSADSTAHDVVVDVEAFTAVRNSLNVVGSVTHSGDPAFFRLKGNATNDFTLTGGGTAVISYRAAHL